MKAQSTPCRALRVLFFTFILFLAYFHSSATTHTVTVQSYAFTPDTFEAQVGDTVKWVWINGSHTCTSVSVPGGAATWDSPINSSSPTFTYVLAVAGTYQYHCSFHPSLMHGLINVSGSTGIAETNVVPVRVYPNPFMNKLNVDAGFNTVFGGTATIEIYDILGAMKYQTRIAGNGSEPLGMDLSELIPGAYFVRVSKGTVVHTFKVTKL